MRFRELSLLGAWNFSPIGENRLACQRGGGTPTTGNTSPENQDGDENNPQRQRDSQGQRNIAAVRDHLQTVFRPQDANEGPPRAEQVQSRLRELQTKVQRYRDAINDRMAKAQRIESLDPQTVGIVAKLQEIDNGLALENINLIGMQNVARKINSWQTSQMPPTKLLSWLQAFHEDDIGLENPDSERFAIEDVAQAISQSRGRSSADALTSGHMPDVTTEERWTGLNPGSRQLVISTLSPLAGIDAKLQYLNDRASLFEKTNSEQNVEGILSDIEKFELPADPGKSGEQGLLRSLNIEFFSINQIIDGFKKWKSAYSDALKGYNNGKSNKVAKKVGKMFNWLPFGEDVSKQMSDKVTNDQAKERKDFMEAIVTRDLGFNDLFGPSGELVKNTGNPSRFLAILEFGSQKGWLYPLMKYSFIDAKKDLPTVQAFGINIRSVVPMEYMDNDILASYLTGLLNKSSQNGAKDMQDQIAAIEGKNDLNGYIELFDKAMKGKGFWKAIGIAKGALGKAKDGATAGILAARLNYWMRDKEIAQYMNDNILGRFASLSWNQIPYSLALYGGQNAKEVTRWGQDSNKKSYEHAADPLTRSVNAVERVLKSRVGGDKFDKMEAAEKAKIVGRVLAGQTADIGNGKYISAFEPEFEEMRESAELLWPEFTEFNLNTAMGGYLGKSEIVFLPESFLNQLFDIGSTGHMPHAPKVILYAQGIIDQADQLDALAQNNPTMATAAANFRRLTSEKLSRVIRSKILDRPPRDLAQLTFERGALRKRNVLDTLMEKRLINVPEIVPNRSTRRAA